MDNTTPAHLKEHQNGFPPLISSQSLHQVKKVRNGDAEGIEPPAEDIELPNVNVASIPGVVDTPHSILPDELDPPSATIQIPAKTIEPLSPYDFRIIALLAPASTIGLLARLGIHALANYDGQSVFPLAWVQAVGCFVMGLCLGWKEIISVQYPELYPALTSGFCGSVTTFSSWQLESFLAFANKSSSPSYNRIWIYDIMDGLTQLLFTLGISFSAFLIGLQLSTASALQLKSFLTRFHDRTHPSWSLRLVVTALSVITYIITIPLYFILSDHYRPIATSALLFAFPGALTRYLLAVFLNLRSKHIPPGTLTANILGTSILALVYVLQRTNISRESHMTTCNMLVGLGDGYCGCLSTVSTFVVELWTLKRKKAWSYFIVSVILGQAVLVLVVGSAMWSKAVGDTQGCAGA